MRKNIKGQNSASTEVDEKKFKGNLRTNSSRCYMCPREHGSATSSWYLSVLSGCEPVSPGSRPHRMGFHTHGRRWSRSPHSPRKPAIPFRSIPFQSNKERRNMKQSLGRSLELLFLVLQRPCRKRPRLVPRLETATKCLSHQLVAIAIPEGLRAMLYVQVIASFVGGEDALQGTSLLSFYHYIILSINISQESALVLILSDPPPVGLCKTPPHKYCLLDTNNTVSKRSLTHQMSAGGHVKKLQRLAAPLNKNETPTTKHPRGCVRVVEKRGYSSHRI